MASILGGSAIARNDYARAFLFPKGVLKCNATGEFVSCLAVDSLAQDRGDVTKIECPSPDAYGQFVEVATIPGELSRMTTTLTGRLSRTEVSEFYKLFIDGCSFDMHLHFGLCDSPEAFNQFDKALIFENVYVTNFGTDPLVALQSADRAVINETIDISIGNFYEIVNLKYNQRANAQTIHGGIVTMEICDRKSCGVDCDDSSSGCDKIFAASSDFYAYYSDDNGVTWTEQKIVAVPPVGATIVDGACWGDNWVLFDSAANIWLVDKSDLLSGVGVFEQVASAISPGLGVAMDTYKGYGVIVGGAGLIGVFTDPEGGTTIVDAGFAAGANALNDVTVGEGASVAVGDAGTVVYSYDTEIWFASPTKPTTDNLSAVAVKSKNAWIVGDETGKLWCTDDGGKTWSRVKYPTWLSNTNPISDIKVASRHVMYMSSGAKLFRSIDGGSSWFEEPNSRLSLPSTITTLTQIAVCGEDSNFVVVGGTSTTATGLVIVGAVA